MDRTPLELDRKSAFAERFAPELEGSVFAENAGFPGEGDSQEWDPQFRGPQADLGRMQVRGDAAVEPAVR